MLDLNTKHVFSLSLTELHVLIFNKSESDNEENWAEKDVIIHVFILFFLIIYLSGQGHLLC